MGLFHKFRSNEELKTAIEIVAAAERHSGKTFTGTSVIVGKASVFIDGTKECICEPIKEFATLEAPDDTPLKPDGTKYKTVEINGKKWLAEYFIPADEITGVFVNEAYGNTLVSNNALANITIPDGWHILTMTNVVELFENLPDEYLGSSPTKGTWVKGVGPSTDVEWAVGTESSDGPMKALWSKSVFADSDDIYGLGLTLTGRGASGSETDIEIGPAQNQCNIWVIDGDKRWNLQGISANSAGYTMLRVRTKNAQSIILVHD